MGQGRIYIYCFGSYFQLLFPLHAVQGAHIVESVRKFDEDDPWIIGQREENLFKVFRLPGGVDIDHIGYFGQPVHDAGDLTAEFPFDVFQADVSIFHGVVKESTDGGPYPQPYLFTANSGYGQGMKYIRLTTLAP